MPTEVNPMLTDAVKQTSTEEPGAAPARAIGALYQTVAHATGLAIQDATHAPQEAYEASQAATVQGVMMIHTVDTAATDARRELAELKNGMRGEKP